MPEINFISHRPWLKAYSISKPEPVGKTLPEWYLNADRYYKHPQTGEPYVDPNTNGKIPTWKACPGIYDIMTTGYVYKTPCDIEFFINDQGKIDARTDNEYYQDFCNVREEIPGFETPPGFYARNFAWWPDWGIKVPEGYSVMYTAPLNRYELPFITTNGIVDNDLVHLPGMFPFFVKEGFTGTVPAGTPIIQLIPFKREDWTSSAIIEDEQSIVKSKMENSEKFRRPKNGGVYLNQVWQRRTYK